MDKIIKLFTAVLTTLLFCGMTLAQEPAVNVDAKIHPNLAEAQKLLVQANQYIATAQKDNKFDMKGHAEAARRFILQADQELKKAAETATAVGEAAEKAKKH
jgi:hypothetical protein